MAELIGAGDSISGEAVEVFGQFNAALQALSDGQKCILQVGSQGQVIVSSAGRSNSPVAAAAAAAALKTGAGRLASVVVTTTGTAQLNITDGAAGTIIAVVAANAAAGTEIKVDRFFSTSLYVNSGAGSPAVTISYD